MRVVTPTVEGMERYVRRPHTMRERAHARLLYRIYHAVFTRQGGMVRALEIGPALYTGLVLWEGDVLRALHVDALTRRQSVGTVLLREAVGAGATNALVTDRPALQYLFRQKWGTWGRTRDGAWVCSTETGTPSAFVLNHVVERFPEALYAGDFSDGK